MIFMPPRHGKALAVDTPIPTPRGWCAIADLRPGDEVFADTGKVCRVVAVSEVWRDRPVYRVMSDDGHSVLADSEHEWVVRLCRKRPVFKVKTTKWLAQRSSERAPLVTAHGAIDAPNAILPIDPYVLGVWLGDGCSGHATITADDADASEIRDEIERRGYRTSERATAKTFGVIGLSVQLRQAGLLRNKHVPDPYLRASPSQRRDLLKGLVDTDGHVAPDGQIEFCGIDYGLCSAVRELVNSLGYKASLIEGRATLNGRDCGPKYRVMFYMPDAAHLKRKAERCREPKRRDRYLTFEPSGCADTVCIEVDSPSHMFLCGRGMIPTHNSELASRRFPAWFLGRNPERSVIAASYNSDLASDFGRDVRNLVGSPEYRTLFGVDLREDSRAANRWHTDKGGVYVAAGVGTAVTGRGAHVFLIDDPFKDRVEADSETNREKVKRWYTSTAYTRLENDLIEDSGELTDDDAIWLDFYKQIETGDAKPFEGSLVVIQTRWHEADLAGWLIEEMKSGGDQWDVLELPAVSDDGKALWPSKYPLARLDKIKRAIGARDWSALYQQRPTAEEGDYFKSEWLKPYDKLPAIDTLRVYGASDYAVTADGGDYTVHIVVGVDPEENMYVLDLWRKQSSSDEWVESFCDLVIQWKPIEWAEEQGQIKGGVGPFLERRQRDRQAWVKRTTFPTKGDKAIRAQSIRGRMALNGLYVPVNAPWYAAFRSELLSCWSGKHDDQADALGLIGQLLDTIMAGDRPDPAAEKARRDDYKSAYSRDSDDGILTL